MGTSNAVIIATAISRLMILFFVFLITCLLLHPMLLKSILLSILYLFYYTHPSIRVQLSPMIFVNFDKVSALIFQFLVR